MSVRTRAPRGGATRTFVLAAAILAPAVLAPSAAGAQSDSFSYTMRMTSTAEGQGAAREGMNVLGRGQVAGQNARFEFTQVGGPPVYQEGTVLLMLDGGKRTLFLDPKQRTYYEADLGSLATTFNAVRGAVGMRMEVTEPQLDVVKVGAGERVLGQQTEQWRMTQKFTMKMSVLGMKQTSRSESTMDLFYGEPIRVAMHPFENQTNALASMFDSPEFVRQMQEATARLPRRMLLKSVTRTTTTDDKGREQRSTTTMEITELTRGAVAASAFEVPSGYTRVEAPTSVAGRGAQGGEGQVARPAADTTSGDKPKVDAKEAVKGALGGLLKRKRP